MTQPTDMIGLSLWQASKFSYCRFCSYFLSIFCLVLYIVSYKYRPPYLPWQREIPSSIEQSNSPEQGKRLIDDEKM